jgi:hypothetical protein
MVPKAFQRALQLAQSGQFKSIEAIGAALRREGFRDAEAVLSGDYVRAQLTRSINKALTVCVGD